MTGIETDPGFLFSHPEGHVKPGNAFYRGDVRPAGHIFLIPPEDRTGDDPKTRPHFLVNRCDPATHPHALGTLAHMSTKATELSVFGSPGHRLAAGSRESFVVASRLLSLRAEALTHSIGSSVGEVRAVRDAVRQAVGLGEGVGPPGSGSVRGRLVRVVEPGIDFSFGFVLTAHRYSAQRRYQVIVPIIDRVVEGENGPEGLEILDWDVLPERQAWAVSVPLAEPLLDTSSLITLTEGWRETRNIGGWLRKQVEVTPVAIDAETLVAIEAKVVERLELRWIEINGFWEMVMAGHKTLFDRAAREELVRRMEGIDPARGPRWGKMNAGQMLAHVNASLAMATGELPTKPRKSPMANALGRWLVIYAMKWPQGAPTAPELLATSPGEWAADLGRFRDLLEQVGTKSIEVEWPRHPAFGKMSGKDWGALGHKHVDHHLRQFGA